MRNADLDPPACTYNRVVKLASHLSCLLLCCAGSQAAALEAIVFSARQVESPLFKAANVTITLRPGDNGRAALAVRAARVMFSGPLGQFSDLQLRCATADLNGPAPLCGRLSLSAASSPLGALRMSAAARYHLDEERLSFDGAGWQLAGGMATVAVRADARRWSAQLHSAGMQANPLRQVLKSYASLPDDFETSGRFDFDASLSGANGAARGTWKLLASGVEFTNPDATIIGEKLALSLGGELEWPRGRDVMLQTTSFSGTSGQALLGPALFDLRKNPLAASGRGDYDGRRLRFAELRVRLQQLLEADGSLDLRLEPDFALDGGLLRINRLEFPAAYTSLIQLAAAATVFGDLKTAGEASGELRLADNAVSAMDLSTRGLDLEDSKGKFRMTGVQGELHWRATAQPDPPASWFSWREGGSYGLSGGAARIDFIAAGRGFALTRPTHIPIFDGGLDIKVLSVADIGLDSMHGSFEGDIQPIGMPRISKAFGWPELAGTLGGRIPRVEYRDKLVTFSGDVVAQVFAGRIVGSNMRLQDPLGPWPRFFADIKLESLDLAMVTDTFSIGSITGRLEGEIRSMELFNWSPVKFDAALGTPRGDRGPHRISAKAVATLSDIGNSGGGGFAKLQSGLLQFFDEYDYDRIGIRCQLANETCNMSGIEKAGIGYYILQGKGLPHIDIVGNAGRVNWPALVGQISEAMKNSGRDIQIRK